MKKSDPYSPKEPIRYAYERAKKTNSDKYVECDTTKFVYTTKQPSPFWSHWKIQPDGRLFAHLGSQNLNNYEYEEVI